MSLKTHFDDPGLHRIESVGTDQVFAPNDPGEIPLERLRRLVQRWGRWILAATLVGGAVGFGLASRARPIYDGVATLLVVQPSGQDGTKATNVATLRGLLETNVLATQAVAKFSLDREPYRITPADLLKDTLILEEVRATNLIRVHARLPESKLAAELADYVANAAVTFNEEINRQQTSAFRGQLKTMLEDATARLKTAEQQLLDFRTTAQVDLTKKDADAALDQRGQLIGLAVDIEGERARLARAQEEIKRHERTLTVPRNVNSEAALRSIEDRPANAEPNAMSAQGLDLTNPFVNPVYLVLEYQIALSRTRLASLEARRRDLVSVQRLAGSELASLGNLYPKEIRLRRLEVEHELAKTVYSEVTLQYERARMEIASGTAKLQLVDHAIPPTAPMPRRRSLWMLLGMLAGAAGALVVVAAMEFLRAR